MAYQPQSSTQAIVARLFEQMAGDSAKLTRAGYTYINGSLIPSALSPILARAIRAGRIVRPGVGMTEKFTASFDPKSVNNVTVQLQTNMGVRARTLKDGFGAGTSGNDGQINLNPKIVPSTVPFDVPLRQLEDQALFFPQMQLQTMLFDEVVETTANYLDNVNNGIDSYHMAKAIAYAMYRGAREATSASDITKYSNVVTIDESKVYTDTYMIQKLNEINSKMANGDTDTQLMTFSGPREIAGRPEIFNWLKTPKTGYILNSDISTKLLYEPNFDIREAERVGTQNRGNIAGYDMQEAPQGIWTLVEKWLGLTAGALDGILGVVFTPLAYAAGGVGKKEMAMLQSTQYDGVVAFPYIKYGGAAYRKMFIIAKNNWTIPTELQNVNNPTPVVAPNSFYDNGFEPIEKVIYDTNGNAVGVEVVANVVKGKNLPCEVTFNITSATGAVNTAVLAVTNGTKTTAVTNNGDGTYTFFCTQGDALSVAISATGFTAQTITVTSANTSKAKYAKAVTLVEIAVTPVEP